MLQGIIEGILFTACSNLHWSYKRWAYSKTASVAFEYQVAYLKKAHIKQ